MKKVLVFGVFDGLHLGHEAMLHQAKRLGEVVVAVARDEVVWNLKHKRPKKNMRSRAAAVRRLGYRAVLGDRKTSSYGVIRKVKPDIIALGYDQSALARDVRKHFLGVKIVRLKAYKAGKYHSSLLVRRRSQM